eukprot:TRINITY_DN24231_c0_g1_i2.p1 TRINITY_DN24231_c0_g1~~TRINITY_DN24231_c0_g1_i2.p1  ORF type:complete len:304 (+),score=54.71 TRINITY_DN24231_c0_g1_i2:31-912(+)
MSGRKKWIFLDSFWYDQDIHWARNRQFRRDDPLNNQWTDWIYMDPDHVDLIVNHKLRNFEYYELIQEPGDCIFIPYAMMHQVEKLDDDFQVAASWMFLPETVYDEEACEVAPLDDDLPIASFDVLYSYTGKGIIPQGYQDPIVAQDMLQQKMRAKKIKHLSLQLFTMAMSRGESSLAGRKKRIKYLYDKLTSYASDPSKGLTVEEMAKVPRRVWLAPASEGDDEGLLDCDEGQEYQGLNDADVEEVEAYLQHRLANKNATSFKPKSTSPMTHDRLYAWNRGPGSRPPGSKDEL